MYAGFENKIIDDFPYIIENIEKTIDDNCPIEYYGIECADGWYNILYEYFNRVDKLFKKYNEKIILDTVKSKKNLEHYALDIIFFQNYHLIN